MTKILLSRRVCTVLPLTLFERTILFKSIPFCGKTICLGIVREEYPMTWDNLQSSTCLIWNRFVTFYTSPIFQMLRKDVTWLGVPYHGFISTDLMELFSVVFLEVQVMKKPHSQLIRHSLNL